MSPALRFRQGSVYLLALLVVLVVSGIAMVMARGAAVRLHLHQQAVAQSQCRAAAMGMLRAVVADLNLSLASGGLPKLGTVQPAGETIGDCTVLLIGRDPSGKKVRFDLIPLAGRIGVNSLIDPFFPGRIREGEALSSLPGMTTAIVAALRDWTDSNDIPDAEGGAERTDGAYLGAPVPYAPRNGPMLALEEVRQVRDVTDALYFGSDVNQNGRLDAGEMANGDGGVELGLRDLLTLENREPQLKNRNEWIMVPPELPVSLNPQFQTNLSSIFGNSRGQVLWNIIQAEANRVSSRLDFFKIMADHMSDAEIEVLWPASVGPERRTGQVDPWSCPDSLLNVLVPSEVAATLIKARPATAPTSPLWLMQALTPQQARDYGPFLTVGSYQFKADLVAIRNDGAGWVHLEATLDCASGHALVTSLRDSDAAGWPLPWCTPEKLRRRTADQDPIALLTTPND